MKLKEHPFLERIRAERRIISAVNYWHVAGGVQLAGTSKKAIERWFERIPVQVQQRKDVRALRERLQDAGHETKLASNGSHRGAMVAERVRRDALDAAIRSVESAVHEVCNRDRLEALNQES